MTQRATAANVARLQGHWLESLPPLCGVKNESGFASDQTSQAIRQRYLNGELSVHLVTSPKAGVELKRGENFQGVTGPATILTEWEPLQVVLEDPKMKPLSLTTLN